MLALLDLLGRRWTLRILWELREQPLTSRALRAACDEASPTVLQARLTPQEGELFLAALNTPATPSKTRHKTIPRNRRRGRPRPTH